MSLLGAIHGNGLYIYRKLPTEWDTFFAVPVIIMLQVIDRGQPNLVIYYYWMMIQLPPFIPISYSQRTSPVQPDYNPHNIEFYLFNMSIPSTL